MRITFKVTPGGREDYLAKFPVVEGLEDVKTDGKIDDLKIRQLLKPWADEGFLTWGNDSRPILAFVVEFFRQLTNISKAADRDDESNAHISAKSKHDETMARRWDRGLYAYVRLDVTDNRTGIQVRISASNPKDCPGHAMHSVIDFAVFVARIIEWIAKDINKNAEREIVHYCGVGDAADVFERAEYVRQKLALINSLEAVSAKRLSCEHRAFKYCSPVHPDCPCFFSGECREPVVPDWLASFENYKKSKITKG